MLDIKVLGPGCTNCVRLEKLVREVLEENKIEATVEMKTARNTSGM